MSSHLAKAPKIVYGSAAIGSRDPFVTEEGINELFATLDKHNITILDTAQLYGPSEQRLGEMKAGEQVHHRLEMDRWLVSQEAQLKRMSSALPKKAPRSWASRRSLLAINFTQPISLMIVIVRHLLPSRART